MTQPTVTTAVRFEHLRDGLGIGTATPRVSWKFHGTEAGWMQGAYEMEVARAGTGTTRHHVASGESVLVPWPASPLTSGESASVRVRAFAAGTNASTPWSAPAVVEAGLLGPDDWSGCCVVESAAPTQTDGDGPHSTVLFRRPFMVKDDVRKARLYMTAHGVYEAWLNGERVGDQVLAPGWTVYQHELVYQTYDVTRQVVHGDNVLGVVVGEGWYAGRLGFDGGRCNIWGDTLGVVARLVVEYDDGTRLTLGTDRAWTSLVGGGVVRSSIYDGELYDARREDDVDGWTRPGFVPGDEWRAAATETLDTSVLRAAESPPIRRVQFVEAVDAWLSPTGRWIVDFGQNLVGWVRAELAGTNSDATYTVTLQHAEVMEDGEVATRPLRQCRALDTVVVGGRSLVWEPRFTYHGFRYVDIDVDVDGVVLDKSQFTAVVVHSDLARTGWFTCSDALLTRLHANVVWSMRGNFVGVPTDCPQRDERLGWTGDIQAFAPTACFLYAVPGFLQTYLRGLAAEQAERAGRADAGVPPLWSPNTARRDEGDGQLGLATAVWGDCVVFVPWTVYEASGDIAILRAQYASMTAWLDEGVVRAEGSRLWSPDSVQLGDWLDPTAPPDDPARGQTDGHLVANAFLARSTEIVATVAGLLGRTDDEARFSADAEAVRSAFVDKYIYTTTGRVVGDSQTGLALALHFGLLPDERQRAWAAARLVDVVRRDGYAIGTGFAGTPVIGFALSSAGRADTFYQMLARQECPSWLYPVTMGATTTWERWDSMLPDGRINPGAMTSFNHYAYGSVAHWLHGVCGGLVPLAPGWRRFAVRPTPGGTLTHAAVRFDSPYGNIIVDWRLLDDGTQFWLHVEVPPSTTCQLTLFGRTTELGCGTYETCTRVFDHGEV